MAIVCHNSTSSNEDTFCYVVVALVNFDSAVPMLIYLPFGFEVLCFLPRLRTLIRPNLLVFLLSMLDLFIGAASLPFPPGISMRYARWYFVHLVVTLYHSDDERQSDIYPLSILRQVTGEASSLSLSLWSCAIYHLCFDSKNSTFIL